MKRKRKLQVLLVTLMFLVGTIPLNVKNAYAWYNTIVKTATYYSLSGTPFAKMGTTTQYGYIGPSGERYPAFYSALLASGTNDIIQGCYWPDKVRIEVSGEDPNSDTLSADRFTGLSVLSSPDDSEVEQEILRIVWNVLAKIEPSGLATALKHTITEGGASTGLDVGTDIAWAQWHMGLPARPYDHLERGLRFGYHLNVDPALEGTYTLNIHYSAEIWWTDGMAGWYCDTLHLYDTITYDYVNTPVTPSISGPTSGYPSISYSYYTSTTDPNGDSLRYEFDWGDGSTITTGWYTSGATATASHSFNLGIWYVRVRAQDSTGEWSGWSSSLTVSIRDYYSLTINAGWGGTTHPSEGTYAYPIGTSVNVTATPSTNFVFLHWSLDGTIIEVNPITVLMDSDHTLYAQFQGGGFGCPILSVFDGSNYVTEGLLDIHNPDGVDLVYNHTLITEPAWTKGAYQLRLTEHPQTHSYIDQVKLYATLEDGTEIELPLIYAWHSEHGNVLPQLLFSDEWKTDTLGADRNNGTSQSIDLRFSALPRNLSVVSFVFQIEGNNVCYKR